MVAAGVTLAIFAMLFAWVPLLEAIARTWAGVHRRRTVARLDLEVFLTGVRRLH